MGNAGAKAKNKNPTELTEDEISYLLENTHFCRKEISEWHAGFLKECKKGRISKKQFIDVYKQYYPNGKPEGFCGYLFKSFDRDNSGELDFTEFIIAISVTSKGDMKEKLTMAFRMFDIDKNNKIDKKEMEKIIDAIYDLVGEDNRRGENAPKIRVAKIMSKLDKNNDGVLSEEEFVNGCLHDESLRKILAPYAI